MGSLVKGKTTPASQLRRKWDRLLDSFQARGEPAETVWTDLVMHYSEDGRYYHTLNHVHHVLTTAEMVQTHARNFSAVQWAVWFHDVVYDPRLSNNEEKSATYAGRTLSKLKIPHETTAAVERLILLTKTHQTTADDADGHVMLDADLAILGSDPARYQRYARAIRQEFSFVPEPVYRKSRRRILAQFLRRDRIYYTDELFRSREKQARRNIEREMALLG